MDLVHARRGVRVPDQCPREDHPTSVHACCVRCSKARRKRSTRERWRARLSPARTIGSNRMASDPSGLVRIALVPRRNEGVLVAGLMFLETPRWRAGQGSRGGWPRNPSFLGKAGGHRPLYARIAGAVLPVQLETQAQGFGNCSGPASFRMTYEYAEIDGAPVSSGQWAVGSSVEADPLGSASWLVPSPHVPG